MYRIVTLLVSLCPVFGPVVSAESWTELRGQALKYMDAGSSAQAESALLASWKLVSTDPQNLPAKVVVAEDLAYLYLDRGKTDAALTFCQEAVAASQKAHGPMATRTADLMNSSGVILRNAGKYADAEAMHLKALKLLTDGGHQDSFSMAETHFSLGILYAYSGRFADSEKSLIKAIQLSATFGKAHLEERARMLDAAARLYTALGRLPEANRYARNAWKIVEGIESPNKNLMIDLLDSRGVLLFEQRKYAEAEKTWLKGREISENCGGGCTAHGYAVSSHLGELYIRLADYNKAEQTIKQTMEVAEQVPALSAADRAVLRGEMALIQSRMRRYDKARPLFVSTIADLEHAGRPVELALMSGYYGEFFAAQRYWEQAAEQFERALQIREKVLGTHPLTVVALMDCAEAYKKLHRKSDAKRLLARAESMTQQCSSCVTSEQTVDVRSFR